MNKAVVNISFQLILVKTQEHNWPPFSAQFLYLLFISWQIVICPHIAQWVKNPPAIQETWVWFLGSEDPQRRKWQPTPVFLPGISHGQCNLAGYSPWGQRSLEGYSPSACKQSYTYYRLSSNSSILLEHTLVQPVCKTALRFLKKLELPLWSSSPTSEHIYLVKTII